MIYFYTILKCLQLFLVYFQVIWFGFGTFWVVSGSDPYHNQCIL